MSIERQPHIPQEDPNKPKDNDSLDSNSSVPEQADPPKVVNPEQRWRQAATDLSTDNWSLFTEMASAQTRGKFNNLFKRLEGSSLPPLEVNAEEGTIGLPVPVRELIVRNMEQDPDLSAIFDRLSKEVIGHVRMKFLVSMLYPDSPERVKALEMIEDGAQFHKDFYNFNLLEQAGQADYTKLRKRVGKLDFPRLINHQAAYDKQVADVNVTYQKKVGSIQPSIKGEGEMTRMLDSIATNPTNIGRYQAGGKDHNFFYGKGNPSKGPLTSFYINPRLEQTEAVFKIIDACLADQDAQAKFHDEAFLHEAKQPERRTNDKIVIYLGGDNHAGISTFLKRLSERKKELQDLLKPEDFRSIMDDLRIPLTPGITFVERDGQSSWDTTKHLLLEDKDYFSTVMDKWWAGFYHRGKQPIKPTELQYRSATKLNDVLGARRMPKMPGLRKV